MVAATSIALLAPPWRSASMALLTSAMSAAEVCGAGPCASAIWDTTDFSGAALDLPATFFPVDLAALAVVCAPLALRAAAGSAKGIRSARRDRPAVAPALLIWAGSLNGHRDGEGTQTEVHPIQAPRY